MTDEVTRAVRSVLGEMTSPETARRLAEALRPIHGREAAAFVEDKVREYTDEFGDFSHNVAPAVWALREASDELCVLFGVTDNG